MAGMADRRIKKIVIHCTATREGQAHTAKDIDSWHRLRGWDGIGYHWVVQLDGTIEKGRDEARPGSHVKGHNADSIGVVYVGGLAANGQTPKDTRAPEQKRALKSLMITLQAKYPGTSVLGHRDLSPDLDGDGVVERHEWLKDCPCFDVAAWLREEGLA